MCLAMTKTPTAPAPPPPPQYLHNPYIDGVNFGMGSSKGRDSLVTSGVSNGITPMAGPGTTGKGTMPTAPAMPRSAPPMSGPGGPMASNGGLTMPAGTSVQGPAIPMVQGQPGSVVPTVGGVMAGAMGGRVTPPTAPPAAARK